jgi:hypothetical protein
MLPCFFQQGDDLLTLHARESFEELLARIPGRQMIEEALDRHPCPFKNWLTTENLRILRDDAAYTKTLFQNVREFQLRRPTSGAPALLLFPFNS